MLCESNTLRCNILRRGLILNVGSDSCVVRFVDIGWEKFVQKDKIFVLPDSLAVVQPIAFICAINSECGFLVKKGPFCKRNAYSGNFCKFFHKLS